MPISLYEKSLNHRLGNLEAQRDWGHATDYVRAMHLMLKQPAPDDYVIATGRTHSVRDFCASAFQLVGLDWENHVVIDEKFYRPAEVDLLVRDPSKARETLGWRPRYGFDELVQDMVRADLEAAEMNGQSQSTTLGGKDTSASQTR